MEITVITPSIGRPALTECVEAVAAQSFPPVAHLIGVDHARYGPAVVRNQLIVAAETDWIAFVDDDDLIDPNHLEVLAGQSNADVRGSYCRFGYRTIPPNFINRPYDRKTLKQHGVFGITVLVKRDLVLSVGGFDPGDRYEDWSMWNRIADTGASFEILPIVTWTYRLSEDNRTWT